MLILLTSVSFQLLLPSIRIFIQLFSSPRTVILSSRFPPRDPFSDLRISLYIPSRFTSHTISFTSVSLNVFYFLPNFYHHSILFVQLFVTARQNYFVAIFLLMLILLTSLLFKLLPTPVHIFIKFFPLWTMILPSRSFTDPCISICTSSRFASHLISPQSSYLNVF